LEDALQGDLDLLLAGRPRAHGVEAGLMPGPPGQRHEVFQAAALVAQMGRDDVRQGRQQVDPAPQLPHQHAPRLGHGAARVPGGVVMADQDERDDGKDDQDDAADDQIRTHHGDPSLCAFEQA
jgi:hypothetical protein